ncbi:MAG: metalloregulator ArsR/SmtB family transcription factor [Actinomycetota bacterium]|nr:metalloregulator ArsR/SmtB family transcription factor [Actinomycetota bacterium]
MDKRVLENLSWLQKRLNVCKAVANSTRLRLLDLLRDGEKCVCELLPYLDMEQSNVSQHLNILKNAGIVVSHRKGQHVLYNVRNDKIFDVMDALDSLLVDELEEASELLKNIENR